MILNTSIISVQKFTGTALTVMGDPFVRVAVEYRPWWRFWR